MLKKRKDKENNKIKSLQTLNICLNIGCQKHMMKKMFSPPLRKHLQLSTLSIPKTCFTKLGDDFNIFDDDRHEKRESRNKRSDRWAPC